MDELSISKYAELFKKAVNEWKINPVTAAVILIQYPKRLSKSSLVIDSINEEMMSSILKAYADGKLTYDFILKAMKIQYGTRECSLKKLFQIQSAKMNWKKKYFLQSQQMDKMRFH